MLDSLKKKNKTYCFMCDGTGEYIDYYKAPNGKTVRIKQTCICQAIKRHNEENKNDTGKN